MVGWAPEEVGFHGDHGRFYNRGMCPGLQVSHPWASGDKIECGLTDDGRITVVLNGVQTAELRDRWPMEFAYPTVTVRSVGAELAIDMCNIYEKFPENNRNAPTQAELSSTVLQKVQDSTVVPPGKSAANVQEESLSVGQLGRWFGWWCGCNTIESGVPETVILQTAQAKAGRVGRLRRAHHNMTND
eukprot:TRINITY_DN10549_c0_g2_i1.p2 TRINITY_DN10549_c0_g2~~TRINITY_DN10549_c0_g2_i1.p2  ORF type:complete len:201 (+),score=32.09 TRINITY_DN10549_c0_g2_i1:45-605(+)